MNTSQKQDRKWTSTVENVFPDYDNLSEEQKISLDDIIRYVVTQHLGLVAMEIGQAIPKKVDKTKDAKPQVFYRGGVDRALAILENHIKELGE